MKKYNCNYFNWLREKFPEYKLEEKVQYLMEKMEKLENTNHRDCSIEEFYCIRLTNVKGDISEFLNKFYHQNFRELREILKSIGIDDIETAFNYFKSVDSINETGEFYYKFSKRFELYGEQNEILKNKYGMNNEYTNFCNLIKFDGNIKKVLENEGDKMLYYMDELLKLEGFTDENKNQEIIKKLPYNLTYEDVFSIFKINYDDKIKEDFKILENFNVHPDKNSWDTYNKANW